MDRSRRAAGPPVMPPRVSGEATTGQPLREGSALRESSGQRAFRAAAQKFAACVGVVNFECARVPFLFPATRASPAGARPRSPGASRDDPRRVAGLTR
ncbi:hypothetical protein STEG23_005344, partial [Scotinomys teguina]